MNFACIFDWDGVIIDSSDHHVEGWRRFAKAENLVFPEHLFKQSFGMKNEQIIPHLWKWTEDPGEIRRIDNAKEALYRDIMKEKGLVALPGVKELLTLLQKNNVPCAIGSSAPLANVATGLDILDYGRFFRTIVSGEDVKLGKPDPQIFLTAAFRLAVLPKHCIVFEDAKVGVAAAKAGGMKVVAVTNTYPGNELSDADLIVSSLEKVTIESLLELQSGSLPL
jgi:5-amino-6-(5-phospho-D-ribitylamino)uracil phosphatase